MKIHELKTWPEPFTAMWEGSKRHEFRNNDRGYIVGDCLHLREWQPGAFGYDGDYTGRELLVRISYIGRGFGIPENYVCMTVEILTGTK